MTSIELKTLLNGVANILQENKAAATPEALDAIANGLTALLEYSSFKEVIIAYLRVPPAKFDDFIASLRKFIDVERKLTDEKTFGLMINLIESIKERNVLLKIIASLI